MTTALVAIVAAFGVWHSPASASVVSVSAGPNLLACAWTRNPDAGEVRELDCTLPGSVELAATWTPSMRELDSILGQPLTVTYTIPPVQVFTIVDQAGVDPRHLARVERAISAQSIIFRRHWATPLVRFGATGWPVYLQTTAAYSATPGASDSSIGFHTDAGPTSAYVDADWRPYSVTLDHEVLEMLVDPSGTATLDGLHEEVCDPVSNDDYAVGGPADPVYLSDFAYPSWFAADSAGPWDYMRVSRRALDPSYGYAPD